MNHLFAAMLWDLRAEWRYNIIPMAFFLGASYLFIVYLFQSAFDRAIVTLLIFSDPIALGFLFVGAMILFEKNENTLQALAVTTLRRWEYLWSKAITLTLVALPVAAGIAFFAFPLAAATLFQVAYAVIVTSLFFIFVGVIGVSRVETFTQYIIVIPLFLLPLSLPLIGLWIPIDSAWLIWIPTQATINLLQYATTHMSTSDLVYSYLYPPVSMAVAYIVALRTSVPWRGDRSR